jgi:hypothetical protein
MHNAVHSLHKVTKVIHFYISLVCVGNERKVSVALKLEHKNSLVSLIVLIFLLLFIF